MNRAERRAWAKENIPRRLADGREASGKMIREARRVAISRINTAIEEDERKRNTEEAKAMGLEVVQGKDLLWTPEKQKKEEKK